jgi:hypothetical protein
MMRWVRRLIKLGLLAAAGYGVYRAWTLRRSPADAPHWSPLPPDTKPSQPARPAETKVTVAPAAATGQRWAEPVDGGCPDGYPIKANTSSKIFHVPGGRSYARTVPERCYATADDAEADGYRAAKA